MKIFQKRLIRRTLAVVWGYYKYYSVRRKYGKDAFIFLCRGKTGDIFLYFRFIEAYIRKNNIDKYILVGDAKNMNKIKALYPSIQAPCVFTSEIVGKAMQYAYCFFGAENLRSALSLMWDQDLLYNRCVTRMTRPFTWIDSYKWFLFGLDDEEAVPRKAIFSPMSEGLKEYLDDIGFEQNKTVIISPYAYCVRLLPTVFWQILAKELDRRGYRVFFMLDERIEQNEFGYPSVFFKYADSEAVLKYAGHFIGLRSGFCDVIGNISCHKVMLYPKTAKELDYWNHRSDIEFSNLIDMGLTKSVCEVVVPFCRDIVNSEPECEMFDERQAEDIETVNRILSEF